MTYRPFTKIPPELLSHILIVACHSDTEEHSIDRFRFPSIPMQVDRYFNKTAASIPLLWSYLRITDVKDLEHIEHRIEFKTGALPLDLYINFGTNIHTEVEEIIKRTILHSPLRFRTITLSYQSESLYDAISGDFWNHLQTLDALSAPLNLTHFSIHNDGPVFPSLHFLPPLGSTIRSLHLSRCGLVWSEVSLPANLEALLISGTQDSDYLEYATILQSLGGSLRHSLQSLSLGELNLEELEHIPTDSCALTSLEELKLHDLDFGELVTLLSILRTPHIRGFSVKQIYLSHVETLPTFDLFWESVRFPRLQHIEIDGFDAGRWRLKILLENVPTSVAHLEVAEDPGEDGQPFYAIARNVEEVRELIAKHYKRQVC